MRLTICHAFISSVGPLAEAYATLRIIGPFTWSFATGDAAPIPTFPLENVKFESLEFRSSKLSFTCVQSATESGAPAVAAESQE